MKINIKKIILPTLFIIFAAHGAHAGWNADSLSEFNLPEGTITGIIKNIMNWLLYILGFVAIIGFVISGFMYLTAAGDETRIGRAKKGMTYSIIGIIVALAGVVIIQAVDAILNAGPEI